MCVAVPQFAHPLLQNCLLYNFIDGNFEMSGEEKEFLLSTQSRPVPLPRASLWRRNCLPCLPKRYIMALLSFLGFVNVYAMRVNLSMAIIVMANGTTELGHSHRVLHIS